MRDKLLLIFLFIFSLFLLGCTQNPPLCGDNVCTSLETDPSSSYFCPSDCKVEINYTKKDNGNCPVCYIWDEKYEECVLDPTCCKICKDDSGCSTKSKNALPNQDPYAVTNCEDSKDCGTVQVACLNNNKFCELVPTAGGVCLIKECVIAFPNSTCELLFDDLDDPPSSVFIDSDAPTNPKTSIEGIAAECALQHELAHTRDTCDCPLCGSEMHAFKASSDCYKDAVENWGVNEEDVAYLKFKSMEHEAMVEYQKCLCDNKVFGEKQKYENGTCDTCEEKLKDILNQGFDELAEDYDIGGQEKFVWVNTSLNSAYNNYCKDYEAS